MPDSTRLRRHSSGFTLIEIIVGIVVLGISLTVITSFVLPAARQSVTPIYQVRAAELAQALLEEITSKHFDANSDRQGGRFRCNDDGFNSCSAPLTPGQHGGQRPRDQFTNVDDYNGLTQISQVLAGGESYADRYANFGLLVEVCYVTLNAVSPTASSTSDCVSEITNYKQVSVTITTPDQQDLKFSSVRGNF